MARKKPVTDDAFILFNVLYEDGRRTSNRKVPGAEVSKGEDDTRAFLEAQDNKIAEMSGNPRGLIKSITRS